MVWNRVGLVNELVLGGALGGTRTHDLILRRDALYPTELLAQNGAEGEI